MALPTTQHLGLILSGLPETLSLLVTDDAGVPVDATSLTLRIVRDHETLLVQDDFFAGYGDPPTLPTHIEKPALTTGIYRFPFGDTSFDEQNSTDLPGEYLIAWRYVGALGSTPRTIIQTAKVVSSKTMSLLPKLRLIVDKAVKVVDDNPEDPVFVGYTDEMLVQFLEGGLAWINAFQPYPMWGGLDAFPDTHWRLLLDAAVCDALTSQEIFAVDTDINYCFVEGTPVSLIDACTTPIEEVKEGDKVLSREGKEESVQAAWCDGIPDELVEIKLWGGRAFTTTKQHEWPVWSWLRNCLCGCGQPVKQGKVFAVGHHTRVPDCNLAHIRGSKKCTTTKQSIYEGYKPIKRLAAEDLVPGDFLMIPRKWDERETDVTVEDALILGYYAAEGHPLYRCADTTKDYRNICWTFCKDELGTWVRDIETYATRNGFRVTISHDPNHHAVYVRTLNDYGKATGALRLARLAEEHIGSGSLMKRLSNAVMHWPKAQKLAFVTGLLRGDGHQSWSLQQTINGSGNSFGVWYATSSQALAEQTHLLLAQLGFPSALIIEPEGEKMFYGKSYIKAKAYKLKVPAGYAHTLADIVWGEQSTALAHARHAREGWTPPRPECMVDEDFVYVPIKGVTIVKNESQRRVFNLTVSGDHSYTVENFATFNSDQGNVFVIDHQPKLATILNATWTRLATMVPAMKRHYVRNGAVRVEGGMNWRFQTLLSAAPTGSLFRKMFIGGP
jgi:hypothetical protein